MDKRTLLSTLWIFLTVNFIFCDVFTLMHSGGAAVAPLQGWRSFLRRNEPFPTGK